MKSMTGYGVGESTVETKTVNIEIKTINHRYCDIVTRIPRTISYVEEKLKAIVKSKIDRGRVEVYVTLSDIGNEDAVVLIDKPLAGAYLSAVEELGKELSIYSDITMDRFLDFPDIIKPGKPEYDDDLIWNICESALTSALENLEEMRTREGEILYDNLKIKLSSIESMIFEIEELKLNMVTDYRERLKTRITDIMDDISLVDEGRLENEIAYYADKSNIDEEVVRLKSHIELFKEAAETNGSVGKKLDFIVQEMNRETNTIGSKALNSDITKRVVEIKTRIEEIREQIQNIE